MPLAALPMPPRHAISMPSLVTVLPPPTPSSLKAKRARGQRRPNTAAAALAKGASRTGSTPTPESDLYHARARCNKLEQTQARLQSQLQACMSKLLQENRTATLSKTDPAKWTAGDVSKWTDTAVSGLDGGLGDDVSERDGALAGPAAAGEYDLEQTRLELMVTKREKSTLKAALDKARKEIDAAKKADKEMPVQRNRSASSQRGDADVAGRLAAAEAQLRTEQATGAEMSEAVARKDAEAQQATAQLENLHTVLQGRKNDLKAAKAVTSKQAIFIKQLERRNADLLLALENVDEERQLEPMDVVTNKSGVAYSYDTLVTKLKRGEEYIRELQAQLKARQSNQPPKPRAMEMTEAERDALRGARPATPQHNTDITFINKPKPEQVDRGVNTAAPSVRTFAVQTDPTADEFAMHADEEARMEKMLKHMRQKDKELEHLHGQLAKQKSSFQQFAAKSREAFDKQQEFLRSLRVKAGLAEEEISRRDAYADSLKRTFSRVILEDDERDAQLEANRKLQENSQSSRPPSKGIDAEGLARSIHSRDTMRMQRQMEIMQQNIRPISAEVHAGLDKTQKEQAQFPDIGATPVKSSAERWASVDIESSGPTEFDVGYDGSEDGELADLPTANDSEARARGGVGDGAGPGPDVVRLDI
jgi:hypothetical protein